MNSIGRVIPVLAAVVWMVSAVSAEAGKPLYQFSEQMREDLYEDDLGLYVEETQAGVLNFRHEISLRRDLPLSAPIRMTYGNLDIFARLEDDPYYRVGDGVARIDFWLERGGDWVRVAQLRLDWRTRGYVYGTLRTWNFPLHADQWLGFTQNVTVIDRRGPAANFTFASRFSGVATPYSGTVKVSVFDIGTEFLYLNRVNISGKRW